MPNTNCDINKGVTVWTTPRDGEGRRLISDPDCESLKRQRSSCGHQVELPLENWIDAATAVAGSGPAYYLLLMEAATDAAVHLGLPRPISQTLVYSTILGTVLRAKHSDEPLGVLRQQVATPGGATISALYKLEQGGLRTTIADAMWACYRRTLQVGGRETHDVGPDRPAVPTVAATSNEHSPP
eukprot:NODE_341_length_2210_cov_12.686256_g269_i1.p4 GENE.NODE_341_length_2210_cov_12.686256_g269_i1~~NODE_341_length_2210_cov_12.686256_g269_i1.p4  ORF type:complete len:184 (+),score=31.65 NODE_341_length_2210_cov_12.686256_g269_i1:1157-1708(+)